MITDEMSMMIRHFEREGLPKSQIARQLGISRQTVYNHLESSCFGKKERKKRTSILEPYKAYIVARLDKYDLSAMKLYGEIQSQGYPGKYNQVKRFVRKVKQKHLLKLTERFETQPGQQAQVDWGECGMITENGVRKKLYVFVFVLGYSRMMFARFTTSTKQPVLFNCLKECFDRLRIPSEILFDNMKQVVDRHPAGERACFNSKFLDFADHYGFLPIAAPPYWARVKGKVESGVKYVKRSFLEGREFTELEDLNLQLDYWIETEANVRIHGTTHQQPVKRYQEELPCLRTNQVIPCYDTRPVELRKVANDSHISYGGVRYSVHPKAVGKVVQVKSEGEQTGDSFSVYFEGELIATHSRRQKGSMRITLAEHHQLIRSLVKQMRQPLKKKPRFEQLIPPQEIQPPRHYYPVIQVNMPSISIYDQFLGEAL